MRSDISLYIDGQEVQFQEVPEILFTYAYTDIYNPTVIKNSFTKTIKIDGCPKNEKIFGCFGDMTKIISYADGKYSGAYFNPSRKIDFILYCNGDVVERGYVKLDKVIKKGKNVSYEITLYGGLGQMLYNLTYGEDGEQLKLSDLKYSRDFNFTINRTTVSNAWKRLTEPDTSTNSFYDTINFVPSYNGIPQDFSADKVAIYAEDMGEFFDKFGITYPDGEYSAVDGWVLGELAKEYDEWQTKDLRSYLQRPCIRFKEIINACCNPDNNGGYEVDLDNEFFNEENPYYEDAWMTLPLLSETEQAEGEEIYPIVDGDIITIPSGVDDKIKMSIDFNLIAKATSTATTLYTGLYGSYQGNIAPAVQYNRAFEVQLVVYKSNGSVVTTSPKYALYSNVSNTNNFENLTATNIEYGSFKKQADGTYKFNDKTYNLLTPTFEYEDGMYGKLEVKQHIIHKYGNGIGSDALFTNINVYGIQVASQTNFGFFNEKIKVSGELGYNVNKEIILKTEGTPCDYFLNYLKMFNLHIWADNVEKRAYVRQRKNYFTGEKIDMNENVDRGEDIAITPLTFDAKWYIYSNEIVSNSYINKTYKDKYGIDYGIQKINTNYNFDGSEKNLIEKNTYKGCICQRGKSKYYTDIYLNDSSYRSLPPFMMDGVQTFLNNGSGDTKEGIYITPKTSLKSVNWWDEKYYDLMPKPDFRDKDGKPIDGANVLLFFNGAVEMDDVNGKWIGFQVSDDIPQFEELNEGEPCWIYVATNYSDAVNPVGSLPMFSRYKTNENGWITHSWDFGTPKELYINGWNIDESSDIYTQYWKPYMNDELDANTRIVECRMRLKGRVNPDYLQSFIYFDGCYWRIQEIIDYDVSSNEFTKVKMVKINNLNSYLV